MKLLLVALLASIWVGPNVRVSADSEKSHFEPMVAGAGNGVLVASTNLTGGDDAMWVTKGYVSTDDGNTWYSVWFPRLLRSYPGAFLVSGDAVVAAGARGRLFYAALCPVAPGVHKMVTCLYRSDDRGWSWLGSTLQIEDHERFLTDRASGFVLVAGKWSGKPDRLVFYVSRNNGTTFSGPYTYASVTGIAYDPCRLADGSILLPFMHEWKSDFDFEGAIVSRSLHVTKPFRLYREPSPPLAAAIAESARRTIAGDFADGDPAMPVFLSHGDRVYAIAGLQRDGAQRIVLRISQDGGRHWSAPRDVAQPHAAGMAQFAPAATVAPDGTIGVSWAEMTGAVTYDERFTASTDSGASFLPARVISTADSSPYDDENVAGSAEAFSGSFMQYSGFTTRAPGGDYFGMAADADGTFHPVWIDSRDGVGAQLYTAAIGVGANPGECAAGPSADLTKTVVLTFDPVRMDVGSGILTVPVRLRNTGSVAVTGLTLTVKKVQADENILPSYHVPPQDVPVILNASDGAQGAGATFDFTRALGDLPSLAPGAVTNAVDVRMRLHNALMAEPVITATISGSRCGS